MTFYLVDAESITAGQEIMSQVSLFPVLEPLFGLLTPKTSVSDILGQIFRAELSECSITFKDDLLIISEGQSVVSSFRKPTRHLHCGKCR